MATAASKAATDKYGIKVSRHCFSVGGLPDAGWMLLLQARDGTRDEA
jgi:hypothetical protein